MKRSPSRCSEHEPTILIWVIHLRKRIFVAQFRLELKQRRIRPVLQQFGVQMLWKDILTVTDWIGFVLELSLPQNQARLGHTTMHEIFANVDVRLEMSACLGYVSATHEASQAKMLAANLRSRRQASVRLAFPLPDSHRITAKMGAQAAGDRPHIRQQRKCA
jgi:hypothetical protein